MTIIEQALAQIKERKLNQFRCCITGAPYATIDDTEIAIALRAITLAEPAAGLQRVIDVWELRALSFNSQHLPSLRGANQKALLAMTQIGHTGNVRVLTYFLTRLFYPQLGSEPLSSEKARARMLFAIELHDAALTWDGMKVTELVQNLSVIDSYLTMPVWHTLWLFESRFSKFGLQQADAQIQEAFASPSVVAGSFKRIESTIKFMFELMLRCAERDGAAGKSGNKMAQEIMFVSAQVLPKIVIPHFQKSLSEADRQRLERKRIIDSKAELRVAHSAIHGKNYAAGDSPVHGQRLAAQLKASLEASKAKKAEANKAKKAEAKPKKPESKLESIFHSLVGNFNMNSK